LSQAATELAETTRGASIAQRQADLVSFYSGYEQLVEILCDAAQYGPEPSLESRYDDIRIWMQATYPSVRPCVVAYLQYEVSDAQRSLDWLGQSGDAFETLFAAPTLEEFLRVDDGGMILRIERTRKALGLYADHLRNLAEQERACG
jgi:hypothetical protein